MSDVVNEEVQSHTGIKFGMDFGNYLDVESRRFEVVCLKFIQGESFAYFREIGSDDTHKAPVAYLMEIVQWPDGELLPRFLKEIGEVTDV